MLKQFQLELHLNMVEAEVAASDFNHRGAADVRTDNTLYVRDSISADHTFRHFFHNSFAQQPQRAD